MVDEMDALDVPLFHIEQAGWPRLCMRELQGYMQGPA